MQHTDSEVNPPMVDSTALSESQRRLLAARLQRPTTTSSASAIKRRDPGAPAVMSTAQQGVLLIDELTEGTNAYNVAQAMRLRGPLDVDALQRSLDELLRRHEVLRTRFLSDGTVELTPARPARLTVSPLAADRVEEFVTQEVGTLFDLGSGELLRAALGVVGPDDHVLVLVIHHIASDGVSKQILNDELTDLYAAFRHERPSPLPAPPLQYADYAAWARDQDDEQADLQWWRDQLTGAPEQVELPFDHPRQRDGRLTGARIVSSLSPEVVEQLQAFSSERRATPYMVLLAAYAGLVERYAGQGSVVVGSPVSGRHDRALERVVGLFLNTLPVRIDTSGAPDFETLLERARTASVDVLRHQRVPFETIVNELHPPRSHRAEPDLPDDPDLEGRPQHRPGLRRARRAAAPLRGRLVQVRPGADLLPGR